MFALLDRRKAKNEAVGRLYRAVVEQARNPVFYELYQVPDSVDGRFELICIHMYLVMDRFLEEGKKGEQLAQALFDRMFRDMDRNLREMGAGDLGVPKHMKRMMRGFNGRANAYQDAMCSNEPLDLFEALERNLYGTLKQVQEDAVRGMAAYMHKNARFLAAQPWTELETGRINFKVMDDEKSKDYGDDPAGMVA